MPCTAGETSAVIDFDGRVRACELRQPLGNLRDFDMNLKVFWESPARRAEPGRIACDQCWCTHVCFIHDSLRYSYRTDVFGNSHELSPSKSMAVMKPVRVPDLRAMKERRRSPS
jgi:MoaA/NifB/PqqE/SkfB family radical SAM enzyme